MAAPQLGTGSAPCESFTQGSLRPYAVGLSDICKLQGTGLLGSNPISDTSCVSLARNLISFISVSST
jgi:hypothetical protein